MNDTNPMLSNNTYDLLKKSVQVVIPSFASLYFGLAAIWGLPAAEEVVGTCAILATFIGALIGISNKGYEPAYDGEVKLIPQAEGPTIFSLEVADHPLDLAEKETILLKVNVGDLPTEYEPEESPDL